MLARCARCQGTFTTDRFGLQTCPHCGSELLLSDPNAPPGTAPPEPPGPAQGEQPATDAGAPAPEPAGTLPPPPPPPPGGYGPPPGWSSPPGSGWGGYPPPPPPGGPSGPELPAPFAERGRRGFFAAFFETWKLVATHPSDFFRRVRIDQPGTAIFFGVIAASVGNAVAAVYSYFSGAQVRAMIESMPEEQARFVRVYLESMTGPLTLAQVIASPLVVLLVIYISAGLLHLLLLLFRGAKRGFDATLTAVAYANGLGLLLAVPGCGFPLALTWGVVVLVIGLGEIQRCGAGKAAAAVLSPVLLACVCCCGVIGLSGPAFLKGLEEAAKQTQQTRI